MGKLVVGFLGALGLIGAGAFAAMYVSDYNRDRALGLRPTADEAIRYGNSLGDGELERIYEVYTAACAKKGYGPEDLASGKQCM